MNLFSLQIKKLKKLQVLVLVSLQTQEFFASFSATLSKMLGLFKPRMCSANRNDVVVPHRGPMRDDPPATYSCEIQQFSKCFSIEGGINLPVFEQEGYKWTLSLYPNGRKDENGEGYLSIYLNIADTSSLPLGWEVKANFKLFLFNKLEGKYLMSGFEETTFHEAKQRWGFSQFLPLKTFMSDMYLKDDTCVIGAEVCVLIKKQRYDHLSFVREVAPSTYEFKIKNVSRLEAKYLDSNEFTAGEYKWRIKFCKSDATFQLTLADSTPVPPGKQVFVDYTLCIENQAHDTEDHGSGQEWFSASRKTSGWFSASNKASGWEKFMSLTKLRNRKNRYLKNDTCTLKAKVTVHKTIDTQ